MSIYEHLSRILNFDRAWHEGCEKQVIAARSIALNECGLPFRAERTALIVSALRRLTQRLPELVEEVHCPLPVPADLGTVLWVVKCPHWGAAPQHFKDKDINFVELALADESVIWLAQIRGLNKELNHLTQRLSDKKEETEANFLWPIIGLWAVAAGLIIGFILWMLDIIDGQSLLWSGTLSVVAGLWFFSILIKSWEFGLPPSDAEVEASKNILSLKLTRDGLAANPPKEFASLNLSIGSL